MKQLFYFSRIICLIGFWAMLPGLGWAQVAAGDSIPARPQLPRKEIGRLKAALRQPILSVEDADSLLTMARRLDFKSGQVVALCQLASLRLQQQQWPQAIGALKEAEQLAGQLRDLRESGWAMGQVTSIQGNTIRANPALSSLFVPVLLSLEKAMDAGAKSKAVGIDIMPGRQLADKQVTFPLNDNNFMKPGPGVVTDPTQIRHTRFRPDFVDRWLDTLIRFDKTSPQVVQQLTERKKRRDSSQALSKAFAKEGDYAKAYQYFLQYTAYKDSLTAEATSRRLASLEYKQNLLKKETQIKLLTKEQQLREQAANRQRQYVFLMIGCIVLLVVLSFILSRNNRAKQLANRQLSEQKEALQRTLAELKTAQNQLIHAEKMASLGELTAGIAHEIQNPLNFVNNFSEVSAELVDELIETRHMAQRDEALEEELLADMQQNLQKINQHGKRASAIVKGMLEHTRTQSGQKEPTDLNALTDEYLKLAYHGIRARDSSFEAQLSTSFDAHVGLVTILPQEIGRVLLNVFNNAFYAVQQRQQTGEPGYRPEVTVSTQREPKQISIRIRDNGMGIPESIRQKIFQPFFTTKPSGQGTGLGLSLSYDIITKGHGGTFSVNSQEGAFTELILTLPVAT